MGVIGNGMSILNTGVAAGNIPPPPPSTPATSSITTPWIKSGSVFLVDASLTASYSGTGNTWYDVSGYGNNGTFVNGATYSTSGGGSIVLNGTNQYVSVPLFNSSTTNITMQTWVYINLPSKGVFVANGYGNGYSIGIGGGGYLDFSGDAAIALWSNVRWINTGQNYGSGWKLVTMILGSSSTPTVYVNTTSFGSYPGTAPIIPTGNFTIGAIPGDNGRYYAGNFGAVNFYNRVLSLAEITANFNATKTKYGV